MKTKTIAVLGSTGSIGQSTLEIVKQTNKFKVVLIVANSNYKKILSQIQIFKPKFIVISNKNTYFKIKKKCSLKKIIILNNIKKINNFIKKIDVTVSAIPGIAGLEPTLALIKLSNKVLLANKESIVCGWKLIKFNSIKYKTKIVPIDSEHFSISELTKNSTNNDIQKIYITASGGPFLNLKKNKLKNIKPKDAIKHPKWKMGKKISVDSATMMNKVLELNEAFKLFSFDKNKYEIIIHPQSLVHAIVEFKNGTTYFLYHLPDMKIPIFNGLFDSILDYSKYFKNKNKKKVSIQNLEFFPADVNQFSVLKLIPKMNKSESGAVIINAANETFVDEFLKNNIHFTDISAYLNLVLKDKNYIKTSNMPSDSVKNICKIDSWGRLKAFELIKKKI